MASMNFVLMHTNRRLCTLRKLKGGKFFKNNPKTFLGPKSFLKYKFYNIPGALEPNSYLNQCKPTSIEIKKNNPVGELVWELSQVKLMTCFHKFFRRLTNLRILKYLFRFSQMLKTEKNPFLTNKEFVFFFNCSNQENSLKKLGK